MGTPTSQPAKLLVPKRGRLSSRYTLQDLSTSTQKLLTMAITSPSLASYLESPTKCIPLDNTNNTNNTYID